MPNIKASTKKPKIMSKVKVSVQFKQFELDNGLMVLLRKDNTVPVVAVDVCYHVGSKNEKSGKTGFAHLFEHLMFEGSEHVRKGEFDKYISLAGGYNNAYTTEDITNYYEVVPSNQLALALWLESDRMLKFSVSEEALLTQREVVKEEKRWRVDNRPYGDSSEKMQGLIFPVGPYHWPVIGSMADLDSATMHDVREFYETYYVPNNATLVVSGDINYAEAETLIRKYFSDVPRGSEIPLPKFTDEELSTEVKAILGGSVAAPGVFLGYKFPAEGTEEYYAMNQLERILSDGNSSRLYRRLVYNSEAVSEFGISVEGMEKSGVFLFSAFVAPGHSESEVLDLFDNEIDKLQTSILDQYEFEKARNSTISSYVGRLSTNNGIADALAHYHTFFREPGLINSEVDRELSVSAEYVRDVAKKFLKKEKRVVIFYYPNDHKES